VPRTVTKAHEQSRTSLLDLARQALVVHDLRPSKLTVRVRFPSPAPRQWPRSDDFSNLGHIHVAPRHGRTPGHPFRPAGAEADAASIAVAERLGMQYEGRIRDHVFTNGAWRDSLLYSVLEHEWNSAHSE
jgi:hypothetical protein